MRTVKEEGKENRATPRDSMVVKKREAEATPCEGSWDSSEMQ